MKSSIEEVWKKGFIDSDKLVAPKVVDLYNQKSKNIVDKLSKMFDINLKAIIFGAVVIALALISFGAPFLALFVFTCLILLVLKGQNDLKGLAKVNKNVSSYLYLKSFDEWLKGLIQDYTHIYRYFYPVLFFACMLRMRLSEDGERFVAGMKGNFTGSYPIFDTPLILIVIISMICFLLAYFAPKIYQADMDLVYGRELDKLSETLNDMEELRS